jgi:alkanesulfonate monooxygenase SsuD/methylene tetrahydromethanopterin reductase-like flavin-dependent oxidoreductase (luciferase family)
MRAPVRRFRFGVQQEVAATGAQWLDGARQAEALGFDSLLMPDHFGLQFGPLAGLSAAAAVTSRLRVGTLVAGNDFRHPLVLAKEAATIDVISAGRFELGLGAGWDGSDYTETGIRFAGAGPGGPVGPHPAGRTRQPHLLAGTPGQIAEDLLSYRERYGISYSVVQDMQPFDQVLPRLAGR